MPRPQVLQVNKAYYPHTGGIEAIVQELSEGLLSNGEYHCRVLACGTERRTTQRSVSGVSVTYVASLGTVASLPISPSFPVWLNRQRADIIHVHLPFPLADLSLRMLAAVGRLPPSTGVVLSWHSDVVRQQWAMPVYAPLLRWLVGRADRILVASPNHVTSSAFLPHYRHKCTVIPFGIDPARFVPTSEVLAQAGAIRQRYGDRIVLFVGRLVYYKGVEYLIEAMRDVPGAVLLIAGSGPMQSQLVQVAARNGVGERVHFLGSVSDAHLIALYHAASVFALPSKEKSEAFGIVQLEAMACGKPVVSTDLPTGVTYVNQDGVTGLTVPVRDASRLAEAIRRLLDDRAYAARLGATARRRVLAEFTLDRMISQTEQVYREVLAERRPG